MPNYELGKVYAIKCNQTGEIYVGSTAQKKMCNRMAGHMQGLKEGKKDKEKKKIGISLQILEGKIPERAKTRAARCPMCTLPLPCIHYKNQDDLSSPANITNIKLAEKQGRRRQRPDEREALGRLRERVGRRGRLGRRHGRLEP